MYFVVSRGIRFYEIVKLVILSLDSFWIEIQSVTIGYIPKQISFINNKIFK